MASEIETGEKRAVKAEGTFMAGQIKQIIDTIVTERSFGNSALISITRTKLLLKGIDPSKYTDMSPDDPVVIARLKKIAKDFGLNNI